MEQHVMMVEQEIRIKAYEIDAMGVVSNIQYVKWFEDLRHAFLDVYYPYDEMLKEQISPVLMNTDIYYRIPLTIHDKPRGHCRLARIRRMKWEMEFEISSPAGMHCTGKQIGGFYDIEAGKPVPIPERLRDTYEREMAELA